ncbi:hypothetical protein COCC4DRAFT_55683 [Bipolaris maydis ATCC 48331]|uniref:C2H2-type domain-containing protein n=2 Tax=Cochliobolus heterostrophus TaxID=5016 RepID=M2URD7_COCH5|nr:uncharacterized protein COCC4DRAFT_55683 [Bipolaris maydis ATCC 48331]EMD96161.1 hypothetical protein COCHEDRAFT_1167098 [Bipolaris maydis C5]KAJ5030835.1 hypothetical protein J3E73DRAFT_405353 [Bipolaris maydis]ENI11020.1 hypothetical protein COCC4DRAFT_55683 [Bipolaris maydis ATCC 48331]KAJ6201055.1 hypothetical protein J3E72DRAFT_237055 [Bipolaris maydis]KAJ6213075.1 hypothetical protein PSV09DRAFT_1167098 [Bipolaris maydis]
MHSATFHLVLEKFKSGLSEKEKQEFATSTLDDVHIAIEKIQRKQQSEKRLRAMNKLELFLEGMKEYEKVVAVFLNTSEILAFVWIASTFHEAFDALLDAYQRIGEHMPLLAQYEGYFRNHPQMTRVLRLMYEDILKFHFKAMKYFQKRMWQQLFQALWKSFDTEFAAILRDLREHMALIESQATVAQFSEILATRTLIELQFDRDRENEVRKRRMVVHQWLAAANCGADQEAYAKVRQEHAGTGKWLLQENRFCSWFDPILCSTHMLWMNGIPGAGKTVLASLVVEEAMKLADVHVAFFYCRYMDSERNTFLAVARGILSQLISQDDALLSYLYEKASTSGQVTLSLEATARELLETSLKAFEKLYIIIDGIDECEGDQRQQIVSFFQDTCDSLPPADMDSLRCLFVSQDDNIARKHFAGVPSLKITEAHTRKDIVEFVAGRSMAIKLKFDLTTDRQQWVQDQVMKSADVSINLEDQTVDWERDQLRVDSKDLCGSLVNIHADGTVVIVHHSAKKYLLDKNLVNLGSGEGNLVLLCISYLCFEGFDVEDDNRSVPDYIPSGYYGFMDYAYAYWARHLDAFLRVQESKDALEEISEAAEVFIDMYWAQPRTKSVPPKSFLARWEALSSNRNFDKLTVAAHLAQKQLIASTAHSSDLQVLKLHHALKKVREHLELESASANGATKLQAMYGENIFKCPRVNCIRFYSGFASQQERDDHIKKHERSFFCSFPGCAMATLGCSTLKELHKHETEFHMAFDYDDEEAEYPELPPQKVSFDCTECDAKFTRKQNLQIHMRSRHAESGSKPAAHVCSTCSKSFVRKGDHTRHVTTTHNDAKSFVCGGKLGDGSDWGCGRVFNRGDMLKRHWKSAKGQVCIVQKQDEEDADNASSRASLQPSAASTPRP